MYDGLEDCDYFVDAQMTVVKRRLATEAYLLLEYIEQRWLEVDLHGSEDAHHLSHNRITDTDWPEDNVVVRFRMPGKKIGQ